MPISIDKLAFDEQIIVKQLKTDLKDDWFPDPIGFADFFDGNLIGKIVSSNCDTNSGNYKPSERNLFNVPKSNFTLRYALETGIADRAIYHALSRQLQVHFDKIISWRAFSHRIQQDGSSNKENRRNTKYSFRNGVMAWADFLGCVTEKIRSDSFLLSTDLANYFENISIATLKSEMISMTPSLELNSEAEAVVLAQIEQLFSYLTCWTYTADRGLPQNRDASSFLANVYMRRVDVAMEQQGFEYFRYMDDIKIVCASEAEARRALKALILELRAVGQSVNSGKTGIIPSTDLEKIKDHLGAGSIEMKRIASAWQTKSLKPIARSFVPLKKLTLDTLFKKKVDSREFRFCIPRLVTLAHCKEFEVPPEYFCDITPLIINALDHSPAATDMICRYLRVVDLNDDQYRILLDHLTSDGRKIYNYKNYRIWILLTQRNFRSDVALELARDTVRQRDDDATRAGATVYLGAMGSMKDRQFIAERFSSLKSFLGQRSALIAVQEVHFKSKKGGGASIREHVQPYLRGDLVGSYTKLNRSGKYVSPLETVSISSYVDLERDYD